MQEFEKSANSAYSDNYDDSFDATMSPKGNSKLPSPNTMLKPPSPKAKGKSKVKNSMCFYARVFVFKTFDLGLFSLLAVAFSSVPCGNLLAF